MLELKDDKVEEFVKKISAMAKGVGCKVRANYILSKTELILQANEIVTPENFQLAA